MTPDLPHHADPDAAYFFDLQGMLYPFWVSQGPWAARKLLDLVRGILINRAPAYIAFAGDLPFPTHRHDLAARSFGDALYKGDRKVLDPRDKASLLEQLRIARELFEDFLGAPTIAVRGWEADDVLATLDKRARAQGLRVVIVGSDRDLMQMVEEPATIMWDGRDRVIGADVVWASLSVQPSQVADYFAIVGGKNNIPGIPGLGAKAAVEILADFGSLEGALSNVASFDVVKGLGAPGPPMPKKYRDKLRAGERDGRISLQLARLDRNVPIDVEIGDLRALPFKDWKSDDP